MEPVSKFVGWIRWLTGKEEAQGASESDTESSQGTRLSESCREKNLYIGYTTRLNSEPLEKLAAGVVKSKSFTEELPMSVNSNMTGSDESPDTMLVYSSTQQAIYSNRLQRYGRRSFELNRDQSKLLKVPQFDKMTRGCLRRAHSTEEEPDIKGKNLTDTDDKEPVQRNCSGPACLVTNMESYVKSFSNTLSKSLSREMCKEHAPGINDHDTISVASGFSTVPKRPYKTDEEKSMEFNLPIERPTYLPSTPILRRLGSGRFTKSRRSTKRNKQRTITNTDDISQSMVYQKTLSRSSPNLNDWKVKNTDRKRKPNETFSSELTSSRVSESTICLDVKTGHDALKKARDSHISNSLAGLTSNEEACTQFKANSSSSVRYNTDIEREDQKADHCAFLSHRSDPFSQKWSAYNEHYMRRDHLKRHQLMMADNQTKSGVDTSRGRILINMQYFNPSSTFRVSLMKAVNIQASFKVSKSATIVAKVSLKPGTHKKKAKKKVVFSENPDIFEDFDFTDISFLELLDMHLKVSLYSRDGFFSRNKLIGAAYISMINYDVSLGKVLWKTLRSLPEKNSQMVVDDLDVGFETEYPSHMFETEFLLNQCYKYHNVNSSSMRLVNSMPYRGRHGRRTNE